MPHKSLDYSSRQLSFIGEEVQFFSETSKEISGLPWKTSLLKSLFLFSVATLSYCCYWMIVKFLYWPQFQCLGSWGCTGLGTLARQTFVLLGHLAVSSFYLWPIDVDTKQHHCRCLVASPWQIDTPPTPSMPLSDQDSFLPHLAGFS